MKKEAALEKPLLDSIKEIIEHSQKINSGEGYYVEVTAQKCRDLTIAAVKKHQARVFLTTGLTTCDTCHKDISLYTLEQLPLCSIVLCRDCAIEQDFGKVE